MPTYAALLRGIGPGNPKMRNPELRRVAEGVGLERVRSVLSSGNLVFDTAERSARRVEVLLEEALGRHLGAPCTTLVRSRRQIERLADGEAFAGEDDGPTARCQITFLRRQPTRPLPDVGAGARILDVGDRAVLWLVDTTRSTTPDLMVRLERAYGREITTRTWRTVRRIAGECAG